MSRTTSLNQLLSRFGRRHTTMISWSFILHTKSAAAKVLKKRRSGLKKSMRRYLKRFRLLSIQKICLTKFLEKGQTLRTQVKNYKRGVTGNIFRMTMWLLRRLIVIIVHIRHILTMLAMNILCARIASGYHISQLRCILVIFGMRQRRCAYLRPVILFGQWLAVCARIRFVILPHIASRSQRLSKLIIGVSAALLRMVISIGAVIFIIMATTVSSRFMCRFIKMRWWLIHLERQLSHSSNSSVAGGMVLPIYRMWLFVYLRVLVLCRFGRALHGFGACLTDMLVYQHRRLLLRLAVGCHCC